MKRRLLRGTMAAVLAVTITLPMGARPVQAFPIATIRSYIELAATAYNLFKSITGGSSDAIQAAVRQIVAAIDAAKTQILAHVDALATADARACARHHVIEFADIDQFSTDTLQLWAQNVTGCVTLIDSLIDTVGDKGQADLLGLALNVAGPIALAARTKAGFSTAALRDTLRHGNSSVIPKLAPSCVAWSVREPGAPTVELYYQCTAHNGDVAEGFQSFYRGQPQGPPIDRPAVENEATRGTSRAVANAVLPTL
jgi:hypothetical protein